MTTHTKVLAVASVVLAVALCASPDRVPRWAVLVLTLLVAVLVLIAAEANWRNRENSQRKP